MDSISHTLSTCALFSGLSLDQLQEISKQYHFSTHRYDRGQVVAFEEDPCVAIGIVVSGSIHIQRIFPSGKLITIETFSSGDSFGEALVFSDSSAYPATLIAREDTSVLYILRADVIQLCTQHARFLENFVRGISNRILLLNGKIKNLSFATVRQKVTNFLLEEYRRQGQAALTLNSTRQELADALGIPRPSLSREMVAMQAEGLITFSRREITLLNPQKLEQLLK
jgi:CRP/FNR family transcriptional regulator, dissimilatory nitrate respiration regulator